MSSRSHIFTPTRRLGWRLTCALAGVVALQLALLIWSTLRPGPVAVTSSVLLSRPAFITFQSLALLAVLVLLWRAVLCARYAPVPAAAPEELPTVTVIVPAYNEGAQILAAIRSIMAGDYPRTKLQVIAIDDGSVDDTWAWIQRASAEFPEHVVALRCAVNRGKREALYEGFGRATGDVIVTVDSDSEVFPDALRNLVSPLVRDPRVGAVSGNVRVLNRNGGALPAMIEVLFACSFEFIRVTQSQVGVVMCCPGALSAYRRDLVLAFKDEWVAQTFLGSPSHIGEDRAMTNLVVRMGYDIRFQANAIVLTTVPERTSQLARMFLRWARSDVRETALLARQLWTRRTRRRWGVHLNLLMSAIGIVAAPIALVWLVGISIWWPSLLGWALAGALVNALLPVVVFGHLRSWRGAWWAFPYALYFLLFLSWIQPYALITPHHVRWLTRTQPEEPGPIAQTRRAA